MDRPLLFLIGPRGAGKTTVAGLVARRLGWDWVDADLLLEARAGRSIRKLFEVEGEAGFREREAALLEELAGRHRCVIATGGGVVLAAANRQRIRAAGLVVWLTADADTLWKRLQADPTGTKRRPDLTVGGRAEVEQLLQAREPLYRETAHVEVPTADRSLEEVAEAVLAHWRDGR